VRGVLRSEQSPEVAVQDWFGTVSLDDAPPAAKRLVDELARMLDLVQPRLLDTETSHAIDRGHGVEVVLRHRTDPESNVSISIGRDEAIVAWLSTHEHFFDGPGNAGRPWTVVTVDVVAAVLRGEYAVEETYKGKHVVRTKVIDRVDGRVVFTTGLLLWQLIPRRSVRRGPLHLSYACRE
jgi:hypothetical protein